MVIYYLRTQGSYFKKIIYQNEIMGNLSANTKEWEDLCANKREMNYKKEGRQKISHFFWSSKRAHTVGRERKRREKEEEEEEEEDEAKKRYGSLVLFLYGKVWKYRL